MKPTEKVKAKERVRVLKLRRETLRELDAGELEQAKGGKVRQTKWCNSYTHCTLGCSGGRAER